MQKPTLQTPPLWSSRNDFPAMLNELGLLGLGVEVGTQLALYASHVREHWLGEKLFCVDPWKAHPALDMTDQQHEEYFQRARTEMGRFPPRSWDFMRMESLQAAAHINNGGKPMLMFDFVYLDADHSYEAMRKDIEAWWPLIKRGGILAGHDWVPDGWHRDGEPFIAHAERPQANKCSPYYVIKAVTEIFPLELISLTDASNDAGWRSWLVRKA